IDGSSGLTIHSRAEVERADFVEIKNIKPGSAALRIYGAMPRPRGWTFDRSVKKPVASLDPRREKEELSALALATAIPEPAEEPLPSAEEIRDIPFAGLAEYESARARGNVIPYLAMQLNGGQYFFEGERGGLSGNANLLASLAVKHERLGGWTLMPVLSSQYQGTKQVTDLVGGGTLFQERMSHSLSVRGLYQLAGGLRLKPAVGYKWELLKETRDEAWGDGLFDYRRPSFSMEAEFAYAEPFSWKAGYDFYYIDFVNYSSLESIIKDSAGNSLARELSGRNVLDSYNHAFTFGGTMEGPRRSYLEGGLAATLRFFPEQHVVKDSGDLDSTTRRDLSSQLAGAWRLPRQLSPRWKAVAGARLSAGYNYSNQNSYDAQRLKFLKNYYDSLSLRAGLDLTLYNKTGAGRPLELSLSATAGRTSYVGRQTQDPSGLYLGDKVHQNEAVVHAALSYPVAPHFVWTAQVGYGRQTSNQQFERLYRYNLKTTTYRFGFGYEF
ncbi:MAG: hypothetical protein RQ748_11010, partial [Elusimicrobiales bacterium]|nr:hypothetical protein [Elusimicrobiales bacterium]